MSLTLLKCGILYMDIKGYSQLSIQNKESVNSFLEKVHTDLKGIKPQGSVSSEELCLLHFNTWGDAIIAIFSRPSFTVKGLNILESNFVTLKNQLGNLDLNMRIVMHWGEVYPLEKDSANFLGDAIITATRIEPLVSPGEVWVTDDFFNEINKDVFKDEFLSDFEKKLSKKEELYLLPKDWGVKKVIRIQSVSGATKNPIPKKYLQIKFKWDKDIITLSPVMERDITKKPFDRKERLLLLNQMQFFLIHNIEEVEAFCAIGAQNFLELNEDLCVGVRLKTGANKELPDYELIAKKCFNNGYKLIRTHYEFPTTLTSIQNLFDRVQNKPTTKLSKDNLKEIKEKSITVFKIRIDPGDYSEYALIFINYSYFCPRFEIGVCRVHKVSMKNENIQTDFGADRYAEKEGVYWIWVKEGKIRAFSFYEISGLDGKNILLKNNLSNTQYTPFISDEELNPDRVLFHLFSSPARSVLERF